MLTILRRTWHQHRALNALLEKKRFPLVLFTSTLALHLQFVTIGLFITRFLDALAHLLKQDITGLLSSASLRTAKALLLLSARWQHSATITSGEEI